MRLDPMKSMRVLKLPIRHEVSVISIVSDISGQSLLEWYSWLIM